MADIKDIALKYIKVHNTMSLATCSENRPWAASVFYANKGFSLYFISNPKVALHCQNISRNPHVALTINEDYRLKGFGDWRKIKGIQMEGLAKLIENEKDLEEAIDIYTSKYKFTSIFLKTAFGIKDFTIKERVLMKLGLTRVFTASFENRFYIINPVNVWLVDNSRSFERRIKVPMD